MEEKELSKYLWKGLDYNRYFVVKIIPQDRHYAVIIMRNNDPYAPKKWCLQYRGNGHYFDTEEELNAYFKERKFKNKLKRKSYYEV